MKHKSDLTDIITVLKDLSEENETSMGIWITYWTARNMLRRIALERYAAVTQHYIAQGDDLDLPSEGFKEVSADRTSQMRCVEGD